MQVSDTKVLNALMTNGWMVCRYLGTCDGKEIAGKPIWNFVFPTRKAAELYWYDTAPGRNDRCTFVRVTNIEAA